jgi:hypothetical protein
MKNRPLNEDKSSIATIQINLSVSQCDLVKIGWNQGYGMHAVNGFVSNGQSRPVSKNLANRFISEDLINCPVITYKIERVINSNNS